MNHTIALNDGTTIPQLGFGTLNVPTDRSGSDGATAITANVVRDALQIGYRHVDTAQMYGNESGVGRCLASSGVTRSEIHVTSKLSNANHCADAVARSFEETLIKLGVAQLDLFLMHWPLPTRYEGDFVSTWLAMLELKRDRRLRSAGVSNFQPDHIHRIVTETGVTPAVNQIEVHPYFHNAAACHASAGYGIAIEAWSPLGQGTVLMDPVIERIARGLGKTPAQVVLRWHIQHQRIVFPKSMHKERMLENFHIFDFELSEPAMKGIDALDRGEAGRIGPNPDVFDWVPVT